MLPNMSLPKETASTGPDVVSSAGAPLVEFQPQDTESLIKGGKLVYPLTGEGLAKMKEGSDDWLPEWKACLHLLQDPARNCQVAIGFGTWPDWSARGLTHDQAMEDMRRRSQGLPGTGRTMHTAMATLSDVLDLHFIHFQETGMTLFQQGVEVRTATTDGDEVIGVSYDIHDKLQINRYPLNHTGLETPVLLIPSMASRGNR